MPLLAMIPGLMGGNDQTIKKSNTTTPTWSPDQQGIQGDLFSWLKQQMSGSGPAPMTAERNAATGTINSNYGDATARMNNALTSRGFGESGKVGTNLQKIELGRQGALAGNEAKFADLEQQQKNFVTNAGMKYAFQNPGQTSTGSESYSPGWGQPINSALSTMTFLSALNGMMGGGGGMSALAGGF